MYKIKLYISVCEYKILKINKKKLRLFKININKNQIKLKVISKLYYYY